VEAGGVGIIKRNENAQLIEKLRRSKHSRIRKRAQLERHWNTVFPLLMSGFFFADTFAYVREWELPYRASPALSKVVEDSVRPPAQDWTASALNDWRRLQGNEHGVGYHRWQFSDWSVGIAEADWRLGALHIHLNPHMVPTRRLVGA
jgi:hypothetical protein